MYLPSPAVTGTISPITTFSEDRIFILMGYRLLSFYQYPISIFESLIFSLLFKLELLNERALLKLYSNAVCLKLMHCMQSTRETEVRMLFFSKLKQKALLLTLENNFTCRLL